MPAVVASRTQRSEQMFEALKRHIMRERQKKKEEQEADAEVERQRKERELQQKQDVMTLEENREQISKLEQTLAQLKDEKHQLFLQLKKVLYEVDNRRRQLIRQHNEPPPQAPPIAVAVSSAVVTTSSTTTSGSNEVVDIYGMYAGVPPMSGHLSHLVMGPSYPPPPISSRESLYKVPPPPPHSMIPPAAMKRPRSPSPPPQLQTFHQNYNQKPPPPPQPRVAYPKSGNYNYYHHNSGSLPPSAPSPSTPGYGYPSQPYAPPTSRPDLPHPDAQLSSKHQIYLPQAIQRPNINPAYMHSSMDHSKIGYPEDKFYAVPPIRPATHVPLHGGAIPIQQPAQGTKTGGITSGYPIRPPASSHMVPVSSTTLGIYAASQPATNSRLVYSQAAAGSRGYMPQREYLSYHVTQVQH
ncbi:Hypothetical protein NTJ_03437 [Nesidiocoris tenuis]|uniref:G protein pathway suppressor 2 n=1 Tax=Nesidiocoris tenuis TaxID=355587 RepID=A0ABN7AHE7_9HEMI|nr:Hypothetical protein NTJ_03437 [Nesidiocoris tenuis]